MAGLDVVEVGKFTLNADSATPMLNQFGKPWREAVEGPHPVGPLLGQRQPVATVDLQPGEAE